MKMRLGLCVTVCALLFGAHAHAGGISDVGVNAYWGADNHGYGDVIGSSTYDINGATITRAASVLTITIATNFAGHAGADAFAAPGGIGYGDLFLAQTWNPFGSDAHHIGDNAADGTKWTYGLSLDNRFSNTGGTFKLYKLNGATNAANILNSESFISCQLGTQCYYRDGQATAVKTTSASTVDTGLKGSWTVTADQQLKFSLNIASSELLNFTSFAMHWGETCQNDVIEGMVRAVPAPGSLPLLALGLVGLVTLRRRATLGR
jgi:hypothetical protein